MLTLQQQHIEMFKITGNWAIMAQQLKEKFALLKEGDQKSELGKENDLIRRIEIRLKKSIKW